MVRCARYGELLYCLEKVIKCHHELVLENSCCLTGLRHDYLLINVPDLEDVPANLREEMTTLPTLHKRCLSRKPPPSHQRHRQKTNRTSNKAALRKALKCATSKAAPKPAPACGSASRRAATGSFHMQPPGKASRYRSNCPSVAHTSAFRAKTVVVAATQASNPCRVSKAMPVGARPKASTCAVPWSTPIGARPDTAF